MGREFVAVILRCEIASRGSAVDAIDPDEGASGVPNAGKGVVRGANAQFAGVKEILVIY